MKHFAPSCSSDHVQGYSRRKSPHDSPPTFLFCATSGSLLVNVFSLLQSRATHRSWVTLKQLDCLGTTAGKHFPSQDPFSSASASHHLPPALPLPPPPSLSLTPAAFLPVPAIRLPWPSSPRLLTHSTAITHLCDPRSSVQPVVVIPSYFHLSLSLSPIIKAERGPVSSMDSSIDQIGGHSSPQAAAVRQKGF